MEKKKLTFLNRCVRKGKFLLNKCMKLIQSLPAVCFLFKKNYDMRFLQKHKYREMYLLERFDIKFYISCKRRVEQAVMQELQKRSVIKLAFVVPMVQIWLGDAILDIFSSDERFEVSVIICTFNNGSDAFIEKEFKRAADYFKERNVRCYLLDKAEKCWEKTGMPDICFYTTPYIDALPYAINLMSVPLTTLSVYVGYAYMIDRIEKTQFNMPIHNMLWRHYIHTPAYLEMAKIYSDIQGENMVFSGYPKMDSMYENRAEEADWKIADDARGEVIKIIYAPHHSIRDAVPQFGTFDLNYRQMYEMARDNAATTSWIIKPHPVLRKTVESEGLMSVEDYETYLKQWDALPNARVVEDGEYLRWFRSSDCIILDSISFLMEYLFTGRPIFFLNRGTAAFNQLGQMMQNVIYQVDAGDISQMKAHLAEMISADPMQSQRRDFFKKHVDYVALNGKQASQFIYDDIEEQLTDSKLKGES